MKLLLLTLALSSLGWLGVQEVAASATPDARIACDPADCDPSDCNIRVECTENGTCVITCTGPNGETCTVEMICEDAPGCAPEDC